jgi:hypothetical protein
LRFPAYPMAPLLVRHQARRFAALESAPAVDRTGAISGSKPKSSLSRRRHLLEVVTGPQDGSSAPSEAAKVLTRQPPISHIGWLTNVSAAQQQVVLRQSAFYAGGAPAANTAAPSAEADAFYTRKIRTVAQTDWGRQLRVDAGLPSAFLAASPANGGFPETGPWRPPVAGEKLDPLSLEMTDRSWDSQTGPERSFQAPDGFASSGSNQMASEDGSRSNSLRGSTLHLDGSALGRWAVDHLQRTLSKPATGMTGVDPRTTIPRSRVSPF